MHGTERRIRERRTFRLPAPQPPFFPAAGSMPQGTTQRTSRMGPDARNGLSLARNDRRFHDRRPGVNDPGLLLRVPPAAFPARSALRLHNRNRFAPASAASQLPARCRFCGLRERHRLSPHSPLGLLHPSGSKRQPRWPPPGPPSDPPDLRSLPTALLFLA
jgi:hypothetical protein